jgi:hypothetical protein
MIDPILKMAEHKHSPQSKNNILTMKIFFEKYLVHWGIEPRTPNPKTGVLTTDLQNMLEKKKKKSDYMF